MVVIALACFVVAVGLGVIALRLNVRAEDLERALDATLDERDGLQIELASSLASVEAALSERDEALSRVQRSRRDAADVATRLRDETEARAVAEAAERAARERCEELERRVGESGVAEVLWELALGRAERLWRTSVSPGLGDRSPLADATDLLQTAIQIDIAAASEEAGADVELTWEAPPDAEPLGPTTSVQVLGVVESVVAATAKSARSTAIAVTVGRDAVEIAVSAVDDEGAPLEVTVPAALAGGPGLARVPRDPGRPSDPIEADAS